MDSNLKDTIPPSSKRTRRSHVDALVDARRLIVAEHAALRRLLERALRLAYEEPARGAYMDDLKQRLRDLAHAFAAHLELEEKLLGALVDACEGLGPTWRARLQDEHALQKILIASMLERVDGDPAPGSLAFEARRISRRLLEDMEHEERDLSVLVASEQDDWLTQTG